MKKLIVISAALLLAASASFAQNIEEFNEIMDIIEDASAAQEIASLEFPYSKVLYAKDSDLKAQRFKFNAYQNSWTLSRNNGWNVVASILTDIYTPVKEDYIICVQNGEDGQRASVQVTFFDPEIYQTILDFAHDNGADYRETSFGKGIRYSYSFGGYSFSLEYSLEEVKITRTTTGSSENSRISTSRSATEDYSYDKYVYTISTGIPASSDYLRDQALKAAKRQAKGKKSRSSDAFL